jgi:phosphoserine aminotransferase
VSKFGVIFASAQANFGIGGLTVVIVRDDLIGRVEPSTPSMLNYKLLSDNRSMYNTPPVFNIYMTKLMLDWMISIGGLEELKRRNERKASIIYDFLDISKFYTTPVDNKCRSMMVVRFFTGEADLDEKFITEAEAAGFINLRADKNVGGMCAAIYNSMPTEGVEKLVEFMKTFEHENPRFTDYIEEENILPVL